MSALNADSSEGVYELEIAGEKYRLAWLGHAEVSVSRVRAFAFTDRTRLLLVRGNDGLQLPGGGLNDGEEPIEGLKRELLEEAGATISNWSRLGSFQIEGITRSLQEIHDFYWCRVTLADEWIPDEDISERVLIPPGDLLDVLPWGRTDPKAAFLLSKALEVLEKVGWT